MSESTQRFVEAVIAGAVAVSLVLAVAVAMRVGADARYVFAFVGGAFGSGMAVLGALFVDRVKTASAEDRAARSFRTAVVNLATAAHRIASKETDQQRLASATTFIQFSLGAMEMSKRAPDSDHALKAAVRNIECWIDCELDDLVKSVRASGMKGESAARDTHAIVERVTRPTSCS